MIPPSMKIVQLKGFSGLMTLVGAVLLGFLALVLFPSAFVQVLWNAVVFEGFAGPEINLGQAALLWGAVLMLGMVVFKPDIQLQMAKSEDDLAKKLSEAEKTPQLSSESSTESSTPDDTKV